MLHEGSKRRQAAEEDIIEIEILPGAVVQHVGSRFGRQVLMVRRGFRDVGSAASLAISATRQEAAEAGGFVQFIVDTADVPESGSLRVVKRPLIGVVDTAAAWRRIRARRFAPAAYHGCRVRQVVQEQAPALGDSVLNRGL